MRLYYLIAVQYYDRFVKLNTEIFTRIKIQRKWWNVYDRKCIILSYV